MHEVLVNRLGGLSLPRKSVVRLTDRPDMTLDVYRGRKTTIQPTNIKRLGNLFIVHSFSRFENNVVVIFNDHGKQQRHVGTVILLPGQA